MKKDYSSMIIIPIKKYSEIDCYWLINQIFVATIGTFFNRKNINQINIFRNRK